MAVNRYNTPAQAQFINTYVPIPFEEMMMAGKMKQDRYDKAAAAADQAVQQAEMLSAIPDSKDEAYVADVQSTMQDIRDKYATKDLSDTMVIRQMNNEINSKVDKNRIRRIQESRAAWDVAQKHRQQLTAKGLYNPLLDEDPALGYDSRTGVYNYLAPQSIDRYDVANKIFGDIKASSTATRDSGGMREYYRGVTEGNIEDVATTQWHSFATDPRGQQLMKLFAIDNNIDYNEIMANPEARKQLAVNTLKDLGKEFVYEELVTVRNLPGSDQGVPSPYPIDALEGPAIEREGFDPLSIGKVKFDEAGDPMLYDKTPEPFSVAERGYSTVYDFEEKPAEVSGEEAIRLEKETKTKLDMARDNFNLPDNLSYEEVYKAYNDITKDMSVKSAPVVPAKSEKEREALAKYIASSRSLRNFWLNDSHKVSGAPTKTSDRLKTDENVFNDLGYTPDEFMEKLLDPNDSSVSVVGFATDSQEPGSIVIQARDKKKKGGGKGADRIVHASSDLASSEITEVLNSVYDAISNGAPGVFFKQGMIDAKTGEPFAIQVVPKSRYNSNKKEWEYDYSIHKVKPLDVNNQGRLIFSQPSEFNELTNGLNDLFNMSFFNLFNSQNTTRNVPISGEGKVTIG